MQQTELIEMPNLQALEEARENFKRYGTTQPTERDIKIYEARQYNLKILAEQKAKREYWRKVMEARAYNLALKMKQGDKPFELREPRSISEIIDRINRKSTI